MLRHDGLLKLIIEGRTDGKRGRSGTPGTKNAGSRRDWNELTEKLGELRPTDQERKKNNKKKKRYIPSELLGRG